MDFLHISILGQSNENYFSQQEQSRINVVHPTLRRLQQKQSTSHSSTTQSANKTNEYQNKKDQHTRQKTATPNTKK
jgi:hypothetical protein